MQYKIKLDDRYKLPRLTYRGELPPPKHYIRKTQAPIIQEVAAGNSAASKKTRPSKSTTQKETSASHVPKTATARYEIFEERNDDRTICSRLSSVMKDSPPLSPEVLKQAGDQLIVSVQFENKVRAASEIELELQVELLSVKAATHHDLGKCNPQDSFSTVRTNNANSVLFFPRNFSSVPCRSELAKGSLRSGPQHNGDNIIG